MGKFIDLTGQRFGRLIVLRRDTSKISRYIYWVCQCDCGNVVSILGTNLKRGATKSCGCLKKGYGLIDLTGQKFSRLTVLRRDNSRIENDAYWICQCDCGSVISVRGSSLRNGHTKSCGCLLREHNLIDLTNQKFGHLTVLRRDNADIKGFARWICQCDCGNIVSIRGDHLRSGNTISCGCINSKGESKIGQILLSLNISFITQKTFENLKNEKQLRFDFFLPEYKCCIEYNGKQHYEAVEYFGGIERFEEQKKRDNIKKQWCKDNNIKLIEIPYTDYDKIDEDYIKSRL